MSQDGSGNQPTRAKIANIIFSEKVRFDTFFAANLEHQAPRPCSNSDQKVPKMVTKSMLKPSKK